MTPELILYPSVAMFSLTIGCMLYMGFCRFRAIHKREVRISFFRTYNEGSQPPRLHLISRHVQNHFEIPPLFHLGVILLFVSGTVSTLSLTLAWLYVAARVVHSAIHLGGNNVSVRFFTFGFSLLVLCGMWGTLFAALLRGAA